MKKRILTQFASLAFFVVMMVTFMSAEGADGRALGSWAWLGIGPRVADDGHVGGGCDFNGTGSVQCDSTPVRTCTSFYTGCTSGVSNTNICSHNLTIGQCASQMGACAGAYGQYYCFRDCL